MTREQIEAYSEAMEKGSIPDNRNPLNILRGVHASLLIKIIEHAFDVVAIARYELRNRGLDEQGMWVGNKKADKLYRMTEQKKSAPLKKAKVKRKGI